MSHKRRLRRIEDQMRAGDRRILIEWGRDGQPNRCVQEHTYSPGPVREGRPLEADILRIKVKWVKGRQGDVHEHGSGRSSL